MDTETESEAPESAFSDADIASAITDEDLRQRSQALHEAQETYEEVAYMANPKMPCPECSGAGSVGGGSLGDICVRCMGTRVLEQPGQQTVVMPPFAALRAAISAYGDALADRALPDGHRAKKNLALPAGSTVPTLESIVALQESALNAARHLQGSPGLVDPHLLADPKKATKLTGEGELGDIDDAELSEIEDAEIEDA